MTYGSTSQRIRCNSDGITGFHSSFYQTKGVPLLLACAAVCACIPDVSQCWLRLPLRGTTVVVCHRGVFVVRFPDCTGTSSEHAIPNQYLGKCNASRVITCGHTSVAANALLLLPAFCGQALPAIPTALVREVITHCRSSQQQS